MKKILLLSGIALAAYGLYSAYKKSDCGCAKETQPGTPEPVASNNVDGGVNTTEIFPDQVKESYDYSWHTLYPTPSWKDIEEVPQEFVAQ